MRSAELAILFGSMIASGVLRWRLRGRARWAVPLGASLGVALVVGLDELRGEGPWFALIEGAAVLGAGLAPLALHAALLGARAASLRLLLVTLTLGALAVGLPVLNGLHVHSRCQALLATRQVPYRQLEARLDAASWLFHVRCVEAYPGESLAQTCRWWTPVGPGSCWSENHEGVAATAIDEGM